MGLPSVADYSPRWWAVAIDAITIHAGQEGSFVKAECEFRAAWDEARAATMQKTNFVRVRSLHGAGGEPPE